MSSLKKKVRRVRLLVVVVGLSIVFLGLVGRLTYLMGFQGAQFKLKALNKWTRTIEIAPKRGTIYDRNGKELALSINVYRVDADMSVLKDYIKNKKLSEEEVKSKLCDILAMDKGQFTKIFDSKDKEGKPSQFVAFKRKVDKAAVDAIKALKLKGMLISDDTDRYYTNNSFLSHVIGHTNAQGQGVTGVELSYNSVLTGMPGIKVVETDAASNDLPFSESVVIKPVDGKNIQLTIDERIQEVAETVAKQTLEENKAKSVSITIMDPKNGEILGMVNYPEYNLNNPYGEGGTDKDIQESWKNRAVSNIFEPGSIFKVITSAAALANNSVNDSDRFECKGSTKIANTTLKCDNEEPHGIETFSDIIKNSCNMGFIQLGNKIGKENFYNYTKLMGFGQKTGIDLPGESGGLIRDVKSAGPVEFATNSYGQGVAVTQVQYMAAFNAVANGGTWIRPHIMKEVSHIDDDKEVVDKKYDNYGARTVLDKEKAAQLRTYLERVVEEGTSTATKIPGYHIAGKTGTAKKVNTENGGYEDGKYISSFAGMAPTSDPKFTLIVTVEEPSGGQYYASKTAVPAAKKLFTELFRIMDVAPESTGAAGNTKK